MNTKQILSLLADCANKLDTSGHYVQADTLTKVMLRVAGGKMLLNDEFADEFQVPEAPQSDQGGVPCEGTGKHECESLNAPTRFYPDADRFLCLDCYNEKMRPKDRWTPYQ